MQIYIYIFPMLKESSKKTVIILCMLENGLGLYIYFHPTPPPPPSMNGERSRKYSVPLLLPLKFLSCSHLDHQFVFHSINIYLCYILRDFQYVHKVSYPLEPEITIKYCTEFKLMAIDMGPFNNW